MSKLGPNFKKIPLICSIPHSGEVIPEQASWLNSLPEKVLMCDVDRYVDRLYEPHLEQLNIPSVKTQWHRYAVDLNRIPEDVDSDSVIGASFKSGTHSRGFHWVQTTLRERLMAHPMSQENHKALVALVYEPFHQQLEELFRLKKLEGHEDIFHIDAHSMPSLGTSEHRDPGELRADIVISDCGGKSCSADFRDLVIAAYVTAGFKVGYNWPYLGGRVTERYGRPNYGQHSIQVELNRSLYMNEQTKQYVPEKAEKTAEKIRKALSFVVEKLQG